MTDINKAIIVGTVLKKPEVFTLNGVPVIYDLGVITTGKYENLKGEIEEETEHNLVVLKGENALLAAQKLEEGSQVYIEGRIKTRKWYDLDNNERDITEIIVTSCGVLKII